MTPLICHVVHRLDYGGLENGVVNLVNRLPLDRYRHAIVCLAGYSEFRDRIQRSDVEVVSMDKRAGKDPASYARLFRYLRQRRPSIVHTRNVGTVDCQLVAWVAQVPGRIHGEHGWEAGDPSGTNPRKLRLRRLCRPAIHRFVPMSQDIARWLHQSVHVPHDRIRQAYNGVDIDRFHPDVVPVRCPWTESGEFRPFVVGTVGRLDAVKNQALLLEAVQRLVTTGRDPDQRLRVVMVGDGSQARALRECSVRLGLADRVWLTGARDDIPALIRAMDVYVLPSINEGISNTLLEAMATARAVIASAVGGTPEIVVPGVTGTLFPSGDVDALAAAIEAYVADETRMNREGMAGRQRVLAEFSLESMTRRYVSIYDEVLHRGRSAIAPGT